MSVSFTIQNAINGKPNELKHPNKNNVQSTVANVSKCVLRKVGRVRRIRTLRDFLAGDYLPIQLLRFGERLGHGEIQNLVFLVLPVRMGTQRHQHQDIE